MKKIFAAVCVIAIGAVFPSMAVSQECPSTCGQGQSCCVIQYSDGTHSTPFCKNGGCYTSTTKKPLKNAKELDATTFTKNNSPSPKAGGKNAKSAKKDQAHQ